MRHRFTIPGKPQPKQRPRSDGRGNFYTPSATRAYEKVVAYSARNGGVRKQIEGPVRMKVAIYWPDRRRRDLTNAVKSIEDGLNGIAYEDDSQIAELVVTKAIDRDNPRAEVVVEEAADG